MRKNRNILYTLFFSMIVFLSSCAGDVKAVVHYSHPFSGTTFYYINGSIEVKLSKENNVIATQYTNGITTLDFGSYSYGNYSITATGQEWYLNTSNADIGFYANIDTTIQFTIDETTNTVNLNIP